MRSEIRLSGSGGQGIILASIIMAEALFEDGKHVAQTQVYGPEARGSVCKAELVISDVNITYKKALHPEFLMSLTGEALNEYKNDLAENAVILIDDSIESLISKSIYEKYKVYKAPIIKSCKEEMNNMISVNIVALGAANHLMGFSSKDSLRNSVRRYVPKDSADKNIKALNIGENLQLSQVN